MQKNDMAEKKKVLFNGEEVPGLVKVDEITLTKSTIEVPSFHRVRDIPSGITKLPSVKVKYKISRNTNTLKFFKDYYTKDEDYDVTIVRTDGHGSEFSRTLLPGCECIEFVESGYDAGSPEYASVTVTLVPWDYIMLESQ